MMLLLLMLMLLMVMMLLMTADVALDVVVPVHVEADHFRTQVVVEPSVCF